jgi:hypothetical protein
VKYISIFATVLLLFGVTTAYAQEGWIDPAPADDIGLAGDEASQSVALDFGFPFNAMSYNSINIHDNGGIVLGNDGTYNPFNEGYVNYDSWTSDYFGSYYLDVGEPLIIGFNTDISSDVLGTV